MVRSQASQYEVPELVTADDRIDHDGALSAMLGAVANVTIVGEEHKLQIPAKIYEQILSRRPILAIAAHDSEVAALVRRLNAGLVVSNTDDSALDQAILSLLDRTRSKKWQFEIPRELTSAAAIDRLDVILRTAIGW